MRFSYPFPELAKEVEKRKGKQAQEGEEVQGKGGVEGEQGASSVALQARRIFDGLSFEVEPGSTVALVGPSGCGKSTITRLLLRFYDVDGGSVRINGQDVRDVERKSVAGHVGVVPQDTVLFNDTVRNNIAYGRLGCSEEQIDTAAQDARLELALSRMPAGLDTVVGERGLKLSGGEKQRVSVARAMLADKPILICDEATSSMDAETERYVMSALRELSRGRTSILIAHRLHTVQFADKIVVIDGGRVAEEGTHAELMRREGGLYRGLWRQQQQRGREENGALTSD